jgi:ATP-dependent DNA ligase
LCWVCGRNWLNGEGELRFHARRSVSIAPPSGGTLPAAWGLRTWQHDLTVILYAFDLIELDGEDLRREPVEVRKATLSGLLRRHGRPGLHVAEHLEGDGPTIFQHACKLGLEGIVSKRKGSHYQSGRSPHWLKSKNP